MESVIVRDGGHRPRRVKLKTVVALRVDPRVGRIDGRVIPVIPRKRRAQFVLAARLCAIAEGLSADRFLRGGAGEILQISGEQLARVGPLSIDLLSKLRERPDRAKVGLNDALSSRATQNTESQDDNSHHGNGGSDCSPNVSIHWLSSHEAGLSAATPCNTRRRRPQLQAQLRPSLRSGPIVHPSGNKSGM